MCSSPQEIQDPLHLHTDLARPPDPAPPLFSSTFERKAGPNTGTIRSLWKYCTCLHGPRGERSLQTGRRDAQPQLRKAARKQDLTGSAEVFLPQNLSRWCLQCPSYATFHHLQTKPRCKHPCLYRLTKTVGSSNTSEQKLPMSTTRYPHNQDNPVWQPAPGNPTYQSPFQYTNSVTRASQIKQLLYFPVTASRMRLLQVRGHHKSRQRCLVQATNTGERALEPLEDPAGKTPTHQR